MNIGDLFSRSIDSLMQARSRTVFTTLSIAVASFSLTMAIGINHGGGAYVEKIINSNTETQTLWVMKKQDDQGTTYRPSKYTGSSPLTFNFISVKPLDQSDLDTIGSTDGVEHANPYIAINDAYVTRTDQDDYQALVTAERSNDSAYLLAGSTNDLQDQEVILPDGYREALQFATPDEAVGTNIKVVARNLSGLKVTTKIFNLTVRAVVKESQEVFQASSLRVTQNTIEQMNKFATKDTPMQDLYIAASAKVTSLATMEQTKQNLIAKGYEAQTQLDRDKGLTSFVSVFQTVLLVFGILAVVTAVFGITNTQYMSVMQRVQSIGLMKALGMGKRDVAMLFRVEAGLIGFFGATVGAGTTALISFFLNPQLVTMANLDPDTKILRVSEVDTVVIILGLTLVAIIAGLVPAKKASYLDPIEALRNQEE